MLCPLACRIALPQGVSGGVGAGKHVCRAVQCLLRLRCSCVLETGGGRKGVVWRGHTTALMYHATYEEREVGEVSMGPGDDGAVKRRCDRGERSVRERIWREEAAWWGVRSCVCVYPSRVERGWETDGGHGEGVLWCGGDGVENVKESQDAAKDCD